MSRSRRYVAHIGFEIWLGILAIITAVVYPTLAAESLPRWTYIVATSGIIVIILLLLIISKGESEGIPGITGSALRDEAVQLAIDINTLLNERRSSSSRYGNQRHEAQIVNEYHLKYANRIVKLANSLVSSGTPKERVRLLHERQTNTDDIARVAMYLKVEGWKDEGAT
jgi:hypothetical protein